MITKSKMKIVMENLNSCLCVQPVVCALFVNQKFVRTAVGCIFPKS